VKSKVKRKRTERPHKTALESKPRETPPAHPEAKRWIAKVAIADAAIAITQQLLSRDLETFTQQELIDALREIHLMHEAFDEPSPFEIRRDAAGNAVLYRN
jgi:hypothetical protein